MEGIHNYQDFYFKRLHKIIKQVNFFSHLPYKTKRNLIFFCKQIKYNEGDTIIRFKEKAQKFSFIIQGSVEIIDVNIQNNKHSLFQLLPTGS